jgi:hypothetical protein
MRKNRSIHHLLRFFFEYLDLSTRIHQHAALGDCLKVRELLAGLTDAESYEYRQAGYLRALEILKGRLPEIDALAYQLFHHRRIAA